ncbi:MAG: ABC transporter ATP-binding protein [Clostridia bacterium]|nr:ABC transporter ATP-binding protein [Clostridia bacterium]
MLEIDNLTKVYPGGKRGADGLTLRVEPGEICGFIGHNGAGKTTTIRCVVGVLGFDGGDIRIDGASVRENPEVCKSKLAYIPDNPDIYDYLTGMQYLNFMADVFNVGERERRERIERYARAFEIMAALPRLISSYSHGMKQKLCIIGALLHEPKLMVLDEPFVGLDPKSSHILKQYMRDICDAGGAIFFSTHVLPVAETLCDKIAIIKDGKLLVCGPTAQVAGDTTLESVFLELTE